MKCALKEARKAYELGEVPIGCVIVKDDKIIARAHNLRETKNSPTAHAEILCIEKASKKLDSWRLIDTTMYITLEPCTMCSGAIISARVPKVIYGAKDPRFGAHVSHLNLFGYKFSLWLILFILSMLEIEEEKRPDFIELESKMKNLF